MVCIADEVTEVEEDFLIMLESFNEPKVILKEENFYLQRSSRQLLITNLQNCNESLMHLEFLSLILLGAVD